MKPSITETCGCKVYEQDGRAWTVYCAEHRPLGSPETPQDLLDECVPRVLELLRNAGITEPDELKHTLEDHARWFVNAHLSPPETPQEPKVGEPVNDIVATGPVYYNEGQPIRCPTCFRDRIAPPLLAVPEGRVRALIEEWRTRAAALEKMFRRPEAKLCREQADELEAALAPLAEPRA